MNQTAQLTIARKQGRETGRQQDRLLRAQPEAASPASPQLLIVASSAEAMAKLVGALVIESIPKSSQPNLTHAPLRPLRSKPHLLMWLLEIFKLHT